MIVNVDDISAIVCEYPKSETSKDMSIDITLNNGKSIDYRPVKDNTVYEIVDVNKNGKSTVVLSPTKSLKRVEGFLLGVAAETPKTA